MSKQSQKAKSRKAATPTPMEGATPRFVVSEDGQIVFANRSFCKLAGLDADENTSVPAQNVIRLAGSGFGKKKKKIEDIESGAHKIFITGREELFDFHFDWLSTPDKRRFLIASEMDGLAPSFSEDEMSAFATKIKQLAKKQAEAEQAARLEVQEDLQRFINMSHDAMIVTDGGGKILRANRTFYEIFGYAEADLRTLSFDDLFDNGEAKGKNNFEARVKTKSGHPHWMGWRLKEREGQTYCVGRDLTDIKQHEADLFKREKQLLEAESIGRMGHWHWRVGSDDIEWSEEIYRIFGTDQTRFTPTIDTLNAMVHKRDVGRVIQAFQRAIIEEKDYDMDFRITRPDHETRYIHCEGRCEKDEEGEVVALYGIMQDMTERMLHERQLREAKNAAERAYAAKSQFLANMSHELRTPLNAIIGFSEMIQQQLLGPVGNEKYIEYVTGIRESGEHLLDLISDILDMSKIEAGKYDLDLETVKIAEIVQLAAQMVQTRADDARISLSTDKARNKKLSITADRRAVLQILLNLLSNAVKFTKEGGTVSVECNGREDFVSLKVTDTGIGIAANKLANITRPFEQGSSSYAREHNGSGLGLAITKELVEMHGGTLHIDSTVGEGTTVTVRLPYKAEKGKHSCLQ